MLLLWLLYIETLPLLYSANVTRNKRQTDIAALHLGKNDILNTETDKDLIARSIIDIAKECVRFGVKDVFISSVTVNTQRNSTFIRFN